MRAKSQLKRLGEMMARFPNFIVGACVDARAMTTDDVTTNGEDLIEKE
jgi:hypothetical protein